jgi:O-antigen/teichoic acid export membrane protein
MLVAYLGLSLVGAGLGAAALAAFGIGDALRSALAPLAMWFAFEALKNLNLTVASGLRSRTLIAAASAADYASRLALLWAAYKWSSVSPAGIVGLLAASSLAATFVFLHGHRHLLSRFSRLRVRSTLLDSIHFAWPMMIWGLFGWLQNMSNRWLLSRFADLSVVAEYGVLVAIASFPVTALLGLVVTYAVPILYERESAAAGSSRVFVLRVAAMLTPLCAAMVLAAAVWHRELSILLSGPSYAEHSYVLPFLMASACTSAICSVLTYAVFAQRRVASLLLANTLPGALGLGFGYFAVGHYQFEGAVLTLMLSHVVAATLFVVAFVRSKTATSSP